MTVTETPNSVIPDILKAKNEQSVIDSLDTMFNRSKQARIPFERQWYLNMAFYFGKQWVTWSPGIAGDYTRLYEPKAPSWRVRLITNRIRPIIRKELAKVTKENPQAFVIPASSDDDDLAAAHAGEAIYEHLSRVVELRKIFRRAEFWAMLCGSGFIKDWFDPTSKDFDGKQGVISAEPVSPFHLYAPNIQEEEIENQPYVIHLAAKDPDWVTKNYNKSVQADTNSSAGVLEQRFLSALGAASSDANKRYVAVKEVWIKPCLKYENGAVFIWAGEQLLWSSVENGDQWPYDHGQYPFIKLDHIPTGRFYAESTITDLIPIQKELNRTRSQIIESKNRMSKPQLVAQRGSVDVGKITSEPGLTILYTPGYQEPKPLPLQDLPSYVMQEVDRCIADMGDLAGQHEVSKGQTPPGVTAATAIAYLQEEDDTTLAHTVHSLEEGVEKIGRHFLSYVQQFWDAPRTVKVLGDNRIVEAYVFSKADLKGNTDLRIEHGSATPRSRAAKQAFITDLIDKGVIPPERGLKYLEMAETTRLYEEMQLDSRQAQRENLRMKLQEDVPVNEWDNHELHIMEHDNYRKRQEFERLPDEIKEIFQNHVSQHKQIIAQAMGQPIMPGEDIPTGMEESLVEGGGENSLESGAGQQI